jgi:hypothetical protein
LAKVKQQLSDRVTASLQQLQDLTWRERVQSPWLSLNQLHAMVRRPEPLLSDADVRLTYCWSPEPDRTKYNSARMAEVAAVTMYQNLYGDAVDLSILQQWAPTDERWRHADIAADGRMLDVKNTRRSPNGTTFSDFRVKCFKANTITGFLSPARPGAAPGHILWLGESSFDHIERLQTQFNSDHLHVDFRRVQHGNTTNESGSLLPPWIFDYPRQPCYVARDAALAYLQEVKPAARLTCPATIAVFTGQTDRLDEPLRTEVAALRAAIERNDGHATRPMLFLHVLDRFCRAMHRNVPFQSTAIRRMLFSQDPLLARLDPEFTMPLSIYDPWRTIHELLGVLTDVDRTCRAEAQLFTTFYLRGVGILKGQEANNRPRTIYAYCGQCGIRPLYLGREDTCDECERLVCGECGHCMQECARCQPRMAQFAMG